MPRMSWRNASIADTSADEGLSEVEATATPLALNCLNSALNNRLEFTLSNQHLFRRDRSP